MHQLLTEKYRPKDLNDILGNEEVLECLKSFDMSNLPHMLFYGPPGTGKTTAIRALLKSIPKHSILELNASDDRGINVVREQIKEFASIKSESLKVIILDEADSMSRDAQDALRRIIEDFKNTRFCFICNYYRKLIEPIVSRCTKFRFFPVNGKTKLIEACIKEKIQFEEDGIDEIIKYSDGDMRKIMIDLQGLSSSCDILSIENIRKFYGVLDSESYEDLFLAFLNESFQECQRILINKNFDCLGLINNLTLLLLKSDISNKMQIIKDLSDIEVNIGNGCSEKIQINAIISTFLINRN